MASTIAAVTTSGGGVVTTADASGNLNLLAGTTTVVALTNAGAAVSGTLSATGITTVAAGSAALPAIVSTTGTADTGLWFPAADTVAASTAGTERLRIDSAGLVGIGTTAPGYKLEVKGASATAGQLSIHDGTGDTTVSGVTAASLLFQARDTSIRTLAEIDAVNTTTNGTGGAMVFQTRVSDTLAERMRIDSSGSVGIGTSSPSSKLHVVSSSGENKIISEATAASQQASMSLIVQAATPGQTVIYMGKTGAATNGQLGYDPNTNAMTMFTNNTERMRIDSSGNVLIGRTTGNADARFTPDGGSTDSSPCIDFSKGSATTTTSQVYARFWCNNQATATGSITANGVSAATFTGYSDIRLKENIVDLPSQLSNIMALRPVEFDFKGYEPGEGHQIGFIAQDVQLVYPDVVGEGTDGMLTLSDMNKNDARLIKCIQEQQALILALTDRIAALEAK